MEVPTWVDIVKTAAYKDLAPYDPDWFYIRAASVARKIYVNGNMGVGALRKSYGGAKNEGVNRYHHKIGSGSVARAVLHQLEAVGVVQKDTKGGRRITPSGQVRHHLLILFHSFRNTHVCTDMCMYVLLSRHVSLNVVSFLIVAA